MQQMTITILNIFLLLYVNFNKFTTGLYFLSIFSILTNFLEIKKKLITMSSTKCLNFKFF